MNRFGNVALFLMVVLISAVATFWFVNRNSPSYPPTPEQHLAQLIQFSGETVEEKFEFILGRFVKDVAEEANEYKKQRQVLPQLIHPAGLTNPEYIAENAALMEDTAKKLREQIITVMGVFDQAEDDIELLLTYQTEETAEDIRARWKELKEKQTVLYVDFFSYEEDIIAAYQNLMNFYAENAEEIHYDGETERLVFSDAVDIQAEEKLRAEIESLNKEQEAVLQAG